VTLNPSRNTLPLAKHTKSIDLEHLKNTQHSFAIQKIEKRITPDQSINEKNTIAILFHSHLKIQSLMWILKTWDQICQTEFLKTVSHSSETYNNYIYIYIYIYIFPKDWLKLFNEGAYSVRNHLRKIHQSKLNSVRIFKETIGWKHETTDWFGLTVKLTKSNSFQPFSKTSKSKTTGWFDKTTGCFSLGWKNI